MSKRDKRNAPMPQSSAGLLRFFEDESHGIKIRPELVIGLTIGIIAFSILVKVIIPAWN